VGEKVKWNKNSWILDEQAHEKLGQQPDEDVKWNEDGHAKCYLGG
jgi:hypothetical protein